MYDGIEYSLLIVFAILLPVECPLYLFVRLPIPPTMPPPLDPSVRNFDNKGECV